MSLKVMHEQKLAELLKKKCINLNLTSTTKKDIILELADLIAKSGKFKDKKVIAKALLLREKLGSTGIGNGVAIPHVKLADVKKFLLIFGRIPQGVDFGALDAEKTYLFFVLVSPQNEVGGHLKIMAKVSHLVKDKFVIERLKKAEDEDEVMEIIHANEK
ncbi:MAG: PTS sugar transporter subunit IIA [Candidatus Omnitrophica bacterium]|nr:PTS sugar transporter subunit IIA [Candidatus Omnitrophota bacterium]